MLYYISLVSCIYAARFENAIIVLDSEKDRYLSLIDSAAYYFELLLKGSFNKNDENKIVSVDVVGIDVEQLNHWYVHFVKQNFIVETTQQIRKGLAPLPIKSGGLIEYRWDHKPSWRPFAHASWFSIIHAFFVLRRVHRLMKQSGIKGILDAIRVVASNQTAKHQPTEKEIARLAAAIDAATQLYPTKTFCLAWAATFVLCGLKKGWPCSLAIGVQTNPFYAHAWAQIGNRVIHDDPIIAQVLAVVLKEPGMNE